MFRLPSFPSARSGIALLLLRAAVAGGVLQVVLPRSLNPVCLVVPLIASGAILAGRGTRALAALAVCWIGTFAVRSGTPLPAALEVFAGASLSLLGPGAYSLDARLAGWRSVVFTPGPTSL